MEIQVQVGAVGFHTGIDFAPYGDTPSNPDIYSVSAGRVVEVHSSPSGDLGCYVVIEDADENYWRYCHMLEGSIEVEEGDGVTLLTKIGQMGDTGQAYGVHLHLEYATTSYWTCSTFMNPCDFLDIPNVSGTIVEYDGDIPPGPTPAPTLGNSNFPWVLIARKLREKRS